MWNIVNLSVYTAHIFDADSLQIKIEFDNFNGILDQWLG